ncbi:hypothetical protein K431DRAFT_280159 [Polychaeton citri CBS 116435]|uniref:Fatty acid hydroxylase domain-containing protein n=1 Tax=Polychaeton citri CBS 116435 TaxID=1314669 RepID=A0A9P4QJN6_9PEZI|nr:hypothetical protein K431DRAFT_280159 [Polychaeton citri CBS 116435]
MANTTANPYDLPPLPAYELKLLPSLIPGIEDTYLALALPVIAYWAVSMIFHFIDECDLFPAYRLHTPAEVLKRNHVSRWDVFRDVVIQQLIQTVVGLALTVFDAAQVCGKEEYDIAVWAQRLRLAQRAIPNVLAFVGIDAIGLAKHYNASPLVAGALRGGIYPDLTQTTFLHGQPTTAPAFAHWELLVASTIYYFVIPALQFILAICIVDTWQYFLHRAMHLNKWLYTTFHSRHHRLYVPYAYGALYNHPFEGFLLDTLGAGIAYLISNMTTRQCIWFFTISTIKTVDDHCGYAFPWDPLQHLTSNNAGYHDVHHQSWGIKTNFSQPFFTFWDGLLGTKWTGGDVSARYERARLAAQKKVDADKPPVAASRAEESVADVEKAKLHEQASQTTTELKAFPDFSAEEIRSQPSRTPRSTTRKRAPSSGLKGLAGRVGDSLHGKSSANLCSENGR